MISFEEAVNIVVAGCNSVASHAVPLLINWGVWKVLQEVTALSFQEKFILCCVMFFMFLFAREVNKASKK
ncbi:Uncharacterised protein [Yersinia enterocolitica]|nr:hypothetical protein [Yersinia enterocolitica]EKN5051833.1 hypothetical protein [Yersinia enterocolitica]EKN6382414.1 hypothetical protein [Yersinia enterocolitica]CQH12119.1 Uncharacterised protein [Yersinia enterocolitica]CRX45017.1 Uncharacterised protein [Yersinia enterocolitica]